MARPTIDQMAREVATWLADAPAQNRQEFCQMPKAGLAHYHHTLGRKIRTHFRLWTYPWEPDIRHNVDHAAEHPDQISMRVIEQVWAMHQEDT